MKIPQLQPIQSAIKHLAILLPLTFFCSAAAAEVYALRAGQEVIGTLKSIDANIEDTLIKVALEFDLGYEELVAANPHLDPWLPVEGGEIVLPTRFILPPEKKRALYLNLAEYRAYYFSGRNRVMSFPISIGRGEWQTPEREKGNVTIEDKIINPNWYPPESIRREHALLGDPLPKVVLPGPDNPLGEYALKLSIDGYFIHGTNRPYGIGMQVTHGCIRLRPDDIKLLFNNIPRRMPVVIYSKPFRVGVQNRNIYFEANPNIQQRLTEREYQNELTIALEKMIASSRELEKSLNWDKIFDIAKKRRGIAWAVNFDQKDSIVESIGHDIRPSAKDTARAIIQTMPRDDLF